MNELTYGYDASRWSLCVECGVLIPLFGMELVGPHVCGAGKAAREPLASLIEEERRVIQSQATEIAALRAQLAARETEMRGLVVLLRLHLSDAAWEGAKLSEAVAKYDAMERQLTEARAELTSVIGQIQRLQPGGSPPPGGPVLLAAWIVEETQARLQALEKVAEAAREEQRSWTGRVFKEQHNLIHALGNLTALDKPQPAEDK